VPTGPYTITGVVVDESGRPVAGAGFDACCINGGTYSHWHLHDVLLTNDAGQFQMTGISAGEPLWFRTNRDGYVQQCAATVAVHGDVAVTLGLVSSAHLTLNAPSVPGFRSVSGTVVETTPTGKQPIAGVGVWFSEFEDFEPANSYSDQAGRFALCGLPADQTVHLQAIAAGGRYADMSVPPGPNVTNIEIVLPE
jgi:hypothetical protein